MNSWQTTRGQLTAKQTAALHTCWYQQGVEDDHLPGPPGITMGREGKQSRMETICGETEVFIDFLWSRHVRQRVEFSPAEGVGAKQQ